MAGETTRDDKGALRTKRKVQIWFILPALALIASAAVLLFALGSNAGVSGRRKEIDGKRMYADVAAQMAMGPRIPGTKGHAACVEWMQASLRESGWRVEIQETDYLDGRIRNLIASRGGEPVRVVLGAHYDTRRYADQDPLPARKAQPVPGANDGASGVAVLLELARVLPEWEAAGTRLVFFDAEDNGGIEGWEWAAGARYFVERLAEKPEAAVIVDMVGDADLKIYKEKNSDARLTAAIWAQAGALGYEHIFVPEYRHAMIDDHTPFLNAGIPAVDIIDFDYPAWHTSGDTLERVSPASLGVTAEVVRAWLLAYLENERDSGGE